MSHPPIQFSHIEITPMAINPFTHKLLITSGLWTHESHLELPRLHLQIHPSKTPKNYVLAAEITIKGQERSYAEPFDSNLATFAGCVSTVAKAFHPYNPVACKHLIQGVSNALIYFGRMYGYVTMDVEEGVVTATSRRDQ